MRFRPTPTPVLSPVQPRPTRVSRLSLFFVRVLPEDALSTVPQLSCPRLARFHQFPLRAPLTAHILMSMMLVDIDQYPLAGNDLMVLETPLLRVSRPVAACQRCRAAKIKCDGKLPACTACEKSNRASECSSTNDQFARGKERSYVATLEARVERLEKKIAEERARRKSSSILMLDAESAAPRRTSVETVKGVKSISKRAARRKEALDIDELVSDFGLL